MQNNKILKIVNIILSLFLGGLLVFGGIMKFENPSPSPKNQIESFQKGELKIDNLEVLKIENYVFGMQQTNYFWQFLGITELLFGVLILSQVFRLLGSILALPIVLNIFLFHLFLEPNEIGELIEMFGLLAVNIWLIIYEYPNWKSIIYNPSNLKINQ
ncbi:MAG: DoxX protein [Flavobacteriaceae bacterium]|nr:DoxX protein [Flavobacteriaceae bacterium]